MSNYKSYSELLRDSTEEDYNGFREKVGVGICERCEEEGVVYDTDSQTMYHWDGKGEDPNRSMILCDGCSKDCISLRWSDWADYMSGRY